MLPFNQGQHALRASYFERVFNAANKLMYFYCFVFSLSTIDCTWAPLQDWPLLADIRADIRILSAIYRIWPELGVYIQKNYEKEHLSILKSVVPNPNPFRRGLLRHMDRSGWTPAINRT